MSKHTTLPRFQTGLNSHTRDHSVYPVGNWNSHAKRRVASSLRTFGRARRFAARHHEEFDAGQHKAWLQVANLKFLQELREEANNNSEGFEPDTRDNSLG